MEFLFEIVLCTSLRIYQQICKNLTVYCYGVSFIWKVHLALSKTSERTRSICALWWFTDSRIVWPSKFAIIPFTILGIIGDVGFMDLLRVLWRKLYPDFPKKVFGLGVYVLLSRCSFSKLRVFSFCITCKGHSLVWVCPHNCSILLLSCNNFFFLFHEYLFLSSFYLFLFCFCGTRQVIWEQVLGD